MSYLKNIVSIDIMVCCQGDFYFSLKHNKIVNIIAYNLSVLLWREFLYSSIEDIITKCFPNSNQTNEVTLKYCS